SADGDAVRGRVSDRQHSGADPRGHVRGARPVCPRRAQVERAHRRGRRGVLAATARAGGLRDVHADDGVEAAAQAVDMRSVIYMMWKEVLELRQDPRIFSIIFIAPILQLTILGYAATTDVRNVPVVIVDADRSAASQALIARFTAVSTFTVVDVVSSVDEVDPYLEGGRAWMALAIPSRYG